MLRKMNLDVRKAVKIYYENVELYNDQIMELLDCSVTTAWRLKKEVREQMAKEGVFSLSENGIPTAFTYKFLGLDIADLEKREQRLQKLMK